MISHRKGKNNMDIIDVLTLIIAFGALLTSIATYHKQNKHNELSVLPICEIYTENFDDYMAVNIENRGLGFMKINDVYFEKNSHKYNNLIDIIEDRTDLSYNLLFKKHVIKADEQLKLIYVAKPSQKVKKTIIENLDGVIVRISYSDAYNKTYSFSLEISFL